MQITYIRNEHLPQLAWVASADHNEGITVTHGAYLETGSTFFFEGAWAGEFAAGRPDLTEVAFGSGAVSTGETVLFVPSLATTDYLYYATESTRLTVANSLALLLATIGDSLAPSFRRYADINNTILEGICAYTRALPTCKGTVYRLMHNNLLFSRNAVTEIAKPEPPDFPDYSAYKAFVAGSYALLVQNARDPHRRFPLSIYTTQSRGYDSTAVNAIAACHGIDGAFTVTTGKGDLGAPEVDDDGSAIAEALGITNVIPIERRAFARDFKDEIYYHAGIHECQDANLKGLVDLIPAPSILLTGTLGEMWYPRSTWYDDHPQTLNGRLARVDLSLHGLTEVRLRAGYVQAAIPYIGARKREQILRITESDEMAKWRLGSAYDRPIPRRIGEEAGVPRIAFGQRKAGSVVEFPVPQTPYSSDLRREYLRFLQGSGIRNRLQVALLPTVQRLNAVFWTARENHYKVVYYFFRAISKIARTRIGPIVLWKDIRGSLFCFAVNKCAAEYAAILKQ